MPDDLRRVLAAAGGPPDVIIDDGSHIGEHVCTTFEALFPSMAAGGVYVIEDLHTSYWPSYGGARRPAGTHGGGTLARSRGATGKPATGRSPAVRTSALDRTRGIPTSHRSPSIRASPSWSTHEPVQAGPVAPRARSCGPAGGGLGSSIEDRLGLFIRRWPMYGTAPAELGHLLSAHSTSRASSMSAPTPAVSAASCGGSGSRATSSRSSRRARRSVNWSAGPATIRAGECTAWRWAPPPSRMELDVYERDAAELAAPSPVDLHGPDRGATAESSRSSTSSASTTSGPSSIPERAVCS